MVKIQASEAHQEKLRVLQRVAESLLESIDLEGQLEQTLRLAVQTLEAERGSVMLVDGDSGFMRIAASSGLTENAAARAVPIKEGIAGWVAANRAPLLLHGGVSEPRFEGVDPSIESSISIPLVSAGDLVGVLNLVRHAGGRFDDDDVALASSLGSLAAIAITKAHLVTELKEREARIHELLSATIGAQEQERRRIAADIHDGFLQDLSALHLMIENLREEFGSLPKAREIASSAQALIANEMQSVRNYIFDLRPASLDEIGLAPTLAALVDRTSTDSLLGDFQDRSEGRRLPGTIETILYRVAQEALRNVTKHARAHTFTVRLTVSEAAQLEVSDDGVGIDGQSQVAGEMHFGIASIRERVDLAGGVIEIGKVLGGGTRLMATVPLNDED